MANLAGLDEEYLKNRVSWIRDRLDPLVARDGPDTLHPDNVIVLFKFFEQLRTSNLTLEAVRDSRLHFALLAITGRATRWPIKLIDQAENIIQTWETEWGPLTQIKANLYGTGGQLYSISTPEDLEKEAILTKWHHKQTSAVNPNVAKRNGDVGFQAGDWWINAMFAYHDGIIASSSSNGGVTTCLEQSYALLLVGDDELDCTDPKHFTYRSRAGDSRRYRLCAGTLDSRKPVRVLRSHTLRSFFAPRAGVRYDGMYKVSGWRIARDAKTNAVDYYISLDRLPSQPPMGPVLEHPLAAELDDYREYKRIRKEIRTNRSLLRDGLELGSPGNDSSCTLDRSAIFNKVRSIETKETANETCRRILTSLNVPTACSEPASDRTSQSKSEDNPFFASAKPEENPFFSGALDSQSGLGKINMIRPEIINYGPVLNAASAAGASVDPFFASALQEDVSKRAAAFRLGAVPSKLGSKVKTFEGNKKAISGGDAEVEGKKKCAELGRRDSKLQARRNKS